MKKTALVVALAGSIALPTLASGIDKIETEQDKLGYTIGADLGANFKKQEVEVNPEAIARGIKDSMSGDSLLMSEEEMRDTLQSFQKELYAKRAAKFKELAEKNKVEGDKFLSQNKSQDGVVALENGLQYKIINEGSGDKPKAEDSVTVEYEGKLISGEVFDSSKKVDKPVTFKLSQVIPGWSQALQLMPEGSTWEVYVPAELAYGARGVGSIGPNETLIFNIHLIKVEKAGADNEVQSEG